MRQKLTEALGMKDYIVQKLDEESFWTPYRNGSIVVGEGGGDSLNIGVKRLSRLTVMD